MSDGERSRGSYRIERDVVVVDLLSVLLMILITGLINKYE